MTIATLSIGAADSAQPQDPHRAHGARDALRHRLRATGVDGLHRRRYLLDRDRVDHAAVEDREFGHLQLLFS